VLSCAPVSRYPINTPQTKEAYYYRTIFEEHFPQPFAAATVPGGPSIACRCARTTEQRTLGRVLAARAA
jgi:asparagine synthetase B (glutamine-hydrolysing)